ncbi:TIGR03986 family type III CRISPR-associated RAMP protein [Trichormus variabilis]|uniref:CRISPR-associated RAMP family protein n=1 Tax=Trichormus variabilis SAG 1403-4b TaxID=447716 RepID=A0A433UGH9_ANAVA|nr:TIGR03986 family CRISPR-associated RAMP protein [Trichormus variabilis]MBD2629615.1 TIGR03986 family CRISPR-associated RAMP protein [Trichormus variabilis FACHB-164]RUS92967.1 CRISPR-associated RAMP family protein [Trichormus variabilis SAG 1403-4b]
MNPKHISNVPDHRKAIAPYNFVELPESVVEVSPDSLPQQNRYYAQSENRYTGRIECTVTTESPLYIRCGFTQEEFGCGADSKYLPDFFYTNPLEKSIKPVIPGSSLRGMLRNLVEIITFSKIDQVADNQRLFFRAVAANPKQDSLGATYKKYILPQNIEAGYLKKDSEGWYIQPAKKEHDKTFAWVREKDLFLQDLINFDDNKYKPQYIAVSYRQVAIDYNDRAKRLFASDVDTPNTYPQKKGVLVTSGNMKQDNSDKLSPRRNHCLVFDCLVFESDSNVEKLRLDERAIEYYRNALTDFQKESPFSKDWGMLNENCFVVFYYPPENGGKVVFFGQSPNFRIPYTHQDNGYAATVANFIPTHLTSEKENSKIDLIDLADTIFGWVKKNNKKELPENIRQRAGRVFVTDAQYQSADERGIWYKGNFNDTITPQILSEPKPTCFQHYLVQSEKDNPQADKAKLKHYASQPESETVIRGHKLYWHKGKNHNFEHPEGDNASGTQVTKIKPIHSGVKFKFGIHFENLTGVELGALLWVINISQIEDKGKQYRLKLGMGKPLGMGSIKIEPQLYLSDRHHKYTQLFNENKWELGESEVIGEKYVNFIEQFEEYILSNIALEDYPKHKNKGEIHHISELPRIEMLLAMLTWDNSLGIEKNTRYMEIQRDVTKFHIGKPKNGDKTINEYKERPVLPTPLQVMGREDNPRIDKPSSSPSNSGSSIDTPKPKPKTKPQEPQGQSSNVEKPIKRNQQPQKKPKGNSEGGNSAAMTRPPKPPK